MPTHYPDKYSAAAVDAAIHVHEFVSPGALESTYRECMCIALRKRGLSVEREVTVSLTYEGITLRNAYRIDMLVEGSLVVELKACTKLLPVHEAQVRTYLRAVQRPVGLLMNFYVPRMKDGIKRIVIGV